MQSIEPVGFSQIENIASTSKRKHLQELVILVLGCILALCSPCADAQGLKGPVDIVEQQSLFAGTLSDFSCPIEQILPRRLRSVGIYVDSKNSVADPQLVQRNNELLQAARDEELALSKALTSLIRAPRARRTDILECLVRHQLRFARDGAFLQTEDRRGTGAVRLFSVTPILSYLALRDAGLMSAEADSAVKQWISNLAAKLEQYEQTYVYSNNISDWTSAGLALAAVALNDHAMLDRAISRVLRSSLAVTPEGVLPQEMARGNAALTYSLFGAQALSVTVAVAQANGRNLLTEPEGAGLMRLFRRMAHVIVEPQAFLRLGGSYESIHPSRFDRQNMGFLMIYYRATQDPVALRAICAWRPLDSWRTGGDWFIFFGYPSMCLR